MKKSAAHTPKFPPGFFEWPDEAQVAYEALQHELAVVKAKATARAEVDDRWVKVTASEVKSLRARIERAKSIGTRLYTLAQMHHHNEMHDAVDQLLLNLGYGISPLSWVIRMQQEEARAAAKEASK